MGGADLSEALPRVELMTTAELARLIRAKESTVRYWRHTGTGPKGFRVGRRVVYRTEEVLRWLDEQQAAEHDGNVV